MKITHTFLLLSAVVHVLLPLQIQASTYIDKDTTSKISYTLSYDKKARTIHVSMQYHPGSVTSGIFVFGNPGFGGQKDIFNCFSNLDIVNADFTVDSQNRTVTISRPTTDTVPGEPTSHIDINYDVIDDGSNGQFQRELFRPVLRRNFFTCPTNCLFLMPQNLYIEAEVTWQNMPFPVYCYFQPRLKPGDTYKCHAYDLVMSFIVGGKNLQHGYCKIGNADTYIITHLSKKSQFNYNLIKNHFTRYFEYLRTFWRDNTPEEYTISMLPFIDDGITHDVGGIGFSKGFGSKYFSAALGDTILNEVRMFNISHEIGHHWFGGTLALGHQHQWFDEGFNDYLTYYSLYHSRIKDRTWFINSLNKLFKTYWESPVSNTPNDSIWTHYWQMGDYNRLPYRRGCIFAFFLDNIIGKTSSEKYDFHDLVLRLKERARENSGSMTIELFKNTLSEFIPKTDVERYMDSYIERGELIEFRDAQMSHGFHVTSTQNAPQIY